VDVVRGDEGGTREGEKTESTRIPEEFVRGSALISGGDLDNAEGRRIRTRQTVRPTEDGINLKQARVLSMTSRTRILVNRRSPWRRQGQRERENAVLPGTLVTFVADIVGVVDGILLVSDIAHGGEYV
jgi:hypothetical protein